MDSERPAELPPKPKHRHVSLRREETAATRSPTRAAGRSRSAEATTTSPRSSCSAIAACSSIDVDYVTGRRAQPDSFDVDVDAEKVGDELGNHLEDMSCPSGCGSPGDAGDAARRLLPDIVRKSHERLCTVSRTIILGTDITTRVD